jgi:hypothetical protein
MREQAEAFREESEALYALLSPLQDADWEQPTQFPRPKAASPTCR